MGKLILGLALIVLTGCVGSQTQSSEWSNGTSVAAREGSDIPLSAGPEYEKRLGNDVVDADHIFPFGDTR